MSDGLLPFTDLPARAAPKWRAHSGVVWVQKHPQEWEYARHLIFDMLITNVLEIARRIALEFPRWKKFRREDGVNEAALGTLRNQIRARMAAEIPLAELSRIKGMKAELAVLDGVDKTSELLAKANAKGDLGASAMAMKLLDDVAARAAGTPSVVKEVRVVIEDLATLRAKAKALTAGAVVDLVPAQLEEAR